MTDEKQRPPGGDEPADSSLSPMDSGGPLEPDPLAHAEDAIDPALLAWGDSPPAPKWYRPIIMMSVCVLIVVMMVWFRHDFLYFFSAPTPMELGEAHQAALSPDMENRLVQLEGVPLAPRNQNSDQARCGNSQGFPMYQRRFLCRGHYSAIPLMGRPDHDLIVQRYLVQQVRISYQPPAGQEAETDRLAQEAVRRVGAVREVRRAEEGELGRLVADIQGRSGRMNFAAVAKSIQFQVTASVPGVTQVRVEQLRREAPGAFSGRLVRLRDLGSRFRAVASFLNECTNYPVDPDTWVVLDGSEAGNGLWDSAGLCYGQSPRQYWPYLVLYGALSFVLLLNILLLVRFVRLLRRR